MARSSRRLLGASIGSIVCAAIIVFAGGMSGPPPARGASVVTTETLLGWVTEFAADRWGRCGQ